MRFFLLTFLLMVFIVIVANIATVVGRSNGIPDVFQMLFPEKFVDTEEQKALETGIVPFENDAADAPVVTPPQQVYVPEGAKALAPKDLDAQSMYDPLGGSVVVSQELDMPHRNEAAVNKWVSEAVGSALTFTLPAYQEHMVNVDKYMAANGMKEFQEFLEASKVVGLMQSRNFDLRTFVTDIPTLAASGVTQGRYRWVYDVPLNLTFLPVGMETYEGLKKDQYLSERLTVRVQLGRVPSATKPGEAKDYTPSGLLQSEAIEIETWEVLAKRGQ